MKFFETKYRVNQICGRFFIEKKYWNNHYWYLVPGTKSDFLEGSITALKEKLKKKRLPKFEPIPLGTEEDILGPN